MHLNTVVVFGVVDENSAFSFHIAGLEVIHHPEPVVEETLVIEVEKVEQGLTVVDSLVRVAGKAIVVCPHIGKSVMQTNSSKRVAGNHNDKD